MLNTYPSTVHIRRAVEPAESISAAEALARWKAVRERLSPKRVVVLRPKIAAVMYDHKFGPRIPAHLREKKPPVATPPEDFGPPTSMYLAWMGRDRIMTAEIIKQTVLHFDSCVSEILGASHRRTVVLPRHIAIYLCRALTGRSLPEVGRAFGGRDHTTIMNAVERITALLDAGDERVTADVAAIKARLGVSA